MLEHFGWVNYVGIAPFTIFSLIHIGHSTQQCNSHLSPQWSSWSWACLCSLKVRKLHVSFIFSRVASTQDGSQVGIMTLPVGLIPLLCMPGNASKLVVALLLGVSAFTHCLLHCTHSKNSNAIIFMFITPIPRPRTAESALILLYLQRPYIYRYIYSTAKPKRLAEVSLFLVHQLS